MTNSIHFGAALAGAPKSFEDTLSKLAEGGISSTFRCYFPQELVFEASVQGLYNWGDNTPSCKVEVVGFVANYVNLQHAGCSLSFEPRYAIVKKLGKRATNHYLAAYGPYARQAKIVLATEKDLFAHVIETSPFQPHIERKQSSLAQSLAKHYKGDVGRTPISLNDEFTRNKFMEDAFRAVRLERQGAQDTAKQKVLEAASIHFTHYHGDLDAKFDGLVGGPEKVRRDATELQAARAAGFATANSREYRVHVIETVQATAQKERKAALQEMVQAWEARIESQLRTLAKS